MSERKLYVLGTASQVPTRYRNHNGYLLRWDEEGFLFDPGEGTQRQMIYSGVTASEITRICISHFHGDHCLGLAGIIQRISLDRVRHRVEAYYPQSGERYFENLKHASIFHDVSDIGRNPITEEGVLFENETMTLIGRKLDHTVEAWGYRIQEKDTVTLQPEKLAAAGIRGPAIGRLKREGSIEAAGRTVRLEEVGTPRPGQSMAFIMDTRLCDAAFELARGVDLLVCESTYLDSEKQEAHDHGHLTASQAATIARDGGAGTLVLTHFSQRYASDRLFLAEAKEIHANCVAARDGDMVPVTRRLREL